MPWSVEYNPELMIVQCVYVGMVSFEDFKEASVKALEVAEAHNTDSFLIDDSLWDGGTSVLDLYNLPKLFEALKFKRGSKGALILPPAETEEAKNAHFFETVCINRGWQIKVFAEHQSAIDWLTA